MRSTSARVVWKGDAMLRNLDRADQLRMPVDKRLHRLGRRGLADGIRDIDREEIRVREEAIHRFQPDVIGIDVPAFLPAERRDRRLRGGEHARRLGADEGVLAVRLVPDRHDVRAVARR